jgi:hypothetical protein
MKMGDSLEKVRETKNHNNQNSRIMETINIKAYTNNTVQIEALKAFMKALKIKFELTNDKPYDPEFVEKINKSKKQIAEGKFTEVKVDDLKAFIDSL